MEKVVKINNCYFEYSKNQGKYVLSNINWEIYQGEIWGVIGENGAGKSTLIKLICGLLYPSSGDIYLFEKLFLEKYRSELLNDISFLSDTPCIYEHLSVYEYLNVFRKALGLPIENISSVLSIVKLESESNIKTNVLSMGLKQRLNIARAMLNNPKLIILDEPTNGLDPFSIINLSNTSLRIKQRF